MTVAEWVMLQEQYNADHAQRNDEEEDIAQDVFDNGIRVNADIHYNRRDDDNRSTDSTEAGGGLHRVVTHISKPVGVLLNPETRDDPARLERSKQHLNRLTPAYITNALMKDEIIQSAPQNVSPLQSQISLERADQIASFFLPVQIH